MECHFKGARGRRVEGSGPLGAPVVLLGEAPGRDEEREGLPFIGAAGRFLWEGKDWSGPTRWQGLDALGLRRRWVRIENVIETRPLDNQLWKLTPEAVRDWQADFWRRVERWTEPVVVVPMGNLALNTVRRAPLPLTQRGKWRIRSTPQGPQIDWRDKISNWRGSIFNIRTGNGNKIKCIPTYHPSYIVRGGADFDVWQADWARIAADADFPELRRDPLCEHVIQPTAKDAHAFRMMMHAAFTKAPREAVCAVDIETMAMGRVMDCIGFSFDPELSMTIDMKAPWAWEYVTAMLRHPIAKGFHYGLYDLYVLWTKGRKVVNPRWDSQQLHHCLDPRDEHRLAYCASRDLRVRYWKHENKEEGKSGGTMVKDPRKRQRYNGKDVCYTRALIGGPEWGYWGQVRERGLLGVYKDHYRRLSAACLHLTQTGFRADDKARRDIEEREGKILVEALAAMDALAYPLKGTKVTAIKRGKPVEVVCKDSIIGKGGGLSPVKVVRYFYDALKCKPFYKRGTGNRTADELAIRRLMRKYKKARPMGNLVLSYRGHAKIKQEVRASIVSVDGRLRSRYSPTTETGRLRAMKVSEVEGINAQNRDRKSDLRRMFVADAGHVLIEVDQAQAEDRIASGMSGHPASLKLARARPGAIDRHIAAAVNIFTEWEYDDLLAAYKAGDPEADEKRQTGKRTKYACWYGMGGYHMAEVTLLESEGRVVLDPDECEEWIGLLKKNDPGIELYQSWIRRSLIEDGQLTSSWGRTVYFKTLRLGKEEFKAAFAWPPQHEVGVLTNQLGFVPLDEDLRLHGRYPGARIVQQGHDSLIVTTPLKHAYKIARFLVDNMGQERTYPGAAGEWSMSMPIGLKVGFNWKEMTEWKECPSADEFNEAAQRYLREGAKCRT